MTTDDRVIGKTASKQVPNDRCLAVYEQLGSLLDDGDDAFIEKGPDVVADAIQDPAFFEGVVSEYATDSYTRMKVIGRPGEHVIRYMEWPPEYSLLPHEHHGRPCFEVLVTGTLFLADMAVEQVDDRRYRLNVIDTSVCGPGDTGVVDPRTGTEIHSVYSPERTRSLHVYPDDKHYSYGYVLEDSTVDSDTDVGGVSDVDNANAPDAADSDVYVRKRFELDASD